MSRTNEELAAEVKKGDWQAAHELWEGVRRFAAKAAQRWDNAFEGRNGVAVDDLINSAYILQWWTLQHPTSRKKVHS